MSEHCDEHKQEKRLINYGQTKELKIEYSTGASFSLEHLVSDLFIFYIRSPSGDKKGIGATFSEIEQLYDFAKSKRKEVSDERGGSIRKDCDPAKNT